MTFVSLQCVSFRTLRIASQYKFMDGWVKRRMKTNKKIKKNNEDQELVFCKASGLVFPPESPSEALSKPEATSRTFYDTGS